MMRKLMIAFMVAVAACGGGGDAPTTTPPGGTGGGTTQTPTLGMTLSAPTLSVQQGASGTVTVTIVRGGGLTTNVDLTLEGAPAGVTGSFSAPSLTGTATTSTLTINTTGAALVATPSLTVRAKASGVSDQTASLALSVTAAPVTPAGNFTLSATPSSVTVLQGASGASTINVTRTNSFAGAVALSVAGAPTGLTTTLGTPSVTGSSSTLTLAATGNPPAGTYTLTITGTSAGVANQTTTVTVIINAAQTSTGNVTFGFCSTSLPIWMAVQDGSGAWTRVTGGANNQFKFTINAATGGVAYVTNTNGSFQLNVFLLGKDELITQGTQQCPGGSSKTLTGTVAGVAGTDVATIAMAGANATGSATNPGFTLNGVGGGAQDLFATKAALVLNGASVSFQVNKVIVRRALNLPDNGTIPVLDFNGAEAFAPATATVTVSNAGSDQLISSTLYYTASGAAGAIANDVSASNTRTMYGIPASKQQAGDLHGLVVTGVTLNGATASALRIATVFFKDLSNRTIALGAAPGASTVTAAASSPVARLRAQWPVQSDYNKYFTATYGQPVGNTTRNVVMAVTPLYLNNASTIDFTMPDLSGVAGWDNNWGLRTGTPVTWSTGSTGWNFNGGINGATPAEAGVLLSGQRIGTITP